MRSIVELAGGDGENNNSNEAGMPQAPRRTVCVTVHQPSEPVFALFTRELILAANGRTVFFGPPANVVPYFTGTTLGYVIDEGANPADFAITIAGGGLIAEGAKQPASPVALAEAWRHALADPNNSLVARRPPSSSLPPHEQAAAALPASPTAAAGVTAAAEDATLHDLLSGQSLSDFPPQDRQVCAYGIEDFLPHHKRQISRNTNFPCLPSYVFFNFLPLLLFTHPTLVRALASTRVARDFAAQRLGLGAGSESNHHWPGSRAHLSRSVCPPGSSLGQLERCCL